MHLWHVSARSRRLYLASSLRSSRRGLSAHCVSRPRYTRQFSGLFFAPVGHRLSVLVRRRAPAALSIACPLSCCMGQVMDHVAVWCGYTPPTTGDCFSCPVHQSCAVGIGGGNGFLGTSGHRQMMNSSVMNLQHRLVLELSAGLSFDQRQAPWRIDLL